MKLGLASDFDQEHLDKWWEVTRTYLFADVAAAPGAATGSNSGSAKSLRGTRRLKTAIDFVERFDKEQQALPEPQMPDNPAACAAILSWVHRRLLRAFNRGAGSSADPLRALESAFHVQVSLIASHPGIPAHLVARLADGDDGHVRRRLQNVVGHYEAKLARLIDRAKRQGLVRAELDPRAAAGLFLAMMQGLALRMSGDPHQRERLLKEAAKIFPIYLNGICAEES